MLRIVKIFDKKQSLIYKEKLASAKFRKGPSPVSDKPELKSNSEFMPAERNSVNSEIQRDIYTNKFVQKLCRPFKINGPMVNSYSTGDYYKKHCDEVEMNGPFRADISFTLFLSEPDEYEGGGLEVIHGDQSPQFRLPAGTGVFYSTGMMHQVLPVTNGTRICAVGWIQSSIKHDERRNILFELEMARDEYIQKHGYDDLALSIESGILKLVQLWVEY